MYSLFCYSIASVCSLSLHIASIVHSLPFEYILSSLLCCNCVAPHFALIFSFPLFAFCSQIYTFLFPSNYSFCPFICLPSSSLPCSVVTYFALPLSPSPSLYSTSLFAYFPSPSVLLFHSCLSYSLSLYSAGIRISRVESRGFHYCFVYFLALTALHAHFHFVVVLCL